VLYKDFSLNGVGWAPPQHHRIRWQCSSSLADNDDEVDCFAEFGRKNRSAFDNLMLHFFDPACTNLLTENSGTTCVYPSVRIAHDGKYEPVFVVGVICAAFCADDDAVIPAEITTSAGRVVPIVIREGYMLGTCPVPPNSDCAAASQFFECGIVGSVVTNASGEMFFLTCEHVLTRLQSSVNTWENCIELTIPSLQARGCALSREVLAFKTVQSLPSPRNPFVSGINTWVKPQGTVVARVLPDSNATGKLTGDIGLIPVPPGLEEELQFPHAGVLTLANILQAMKKAAGISVHLQRATSGSPHPGQTSTHKLSNLIHIKAVDEEGMEYPSSLHERILLGQYVIDGLDFGTAGDSGRLVFVESSCGKRYVVGIFVGSFNRQKTRFIVTPGEAVVLAGFSFHNFAEASAT
jgi:hypothetical protein